MRESSDGGDPTVDVEAIERALEGMPVTLAVLYGSRARGEATAGRDVDLAVAFEDSLSSVERTRARLAVVERVSAALNTDDVDVVPLSRAGPDLVREIGEDGTVIVGSRTALGAFLEPSAPTRTYEERLAELDAVLTGWQRVV